MAGQAARQSATTIPRKAGVDALPNVRLSRVDADTTYFQHTLSQNAVVLKGVKAPMLSLGHASKVSLAEELVERFDDLHLIGDCLGPCTVGEAVFEGLKIGCRI